MGKIQVLLSLRSYTDPGNRQVSRMSSNEELLPFVMTSCRRPSPMWSRPASPAVRVAWRTVENSAAPVRTAAVVETIRVLEEVGSMAAASRLLRGGELATDVVQGAADVGAQRRPGADPGECEHGGQNQTVRCPTSHE